MRRSRRQEISSVEIRMNIRRLVLALVLTLLTSSGFVFEQIAANDAENYNGNLWLVEFNNAPTADGGNSAVVQKDKADFRSAASRAGITYVERKSFGTLWNGLSVG